MFELSMLPKSLDPDFLFIHFLWNLYFLVSHLPFFYEPYRHKLNTQIKPDFTVSVGLVFQETSKPFPRATVPRYLLSNSV